MRTSFAHYFERSEEAAVKALFDGVAWDAGQARAVQEDAKGLITRMRAQKRPAGQLESFLQDYAIDTEEGLALMTLAEALLRVPDKRTANALIHDKVAAANWLDSVGDSKDWVVKAAGVGLFMTTKTLDGVLNRIGQPFIREAMVKAMRILGKQFVLGRDIEEAVQNAYKLKNKGYRMSYDILGEGARTALDAERYYESYARAIQYIGERGDQNEARRPGISVKLSALHPRYEMAQRDRCVPEMSEKLLNLARMAAEDKLAFTVDAEECARLDLSLEIIENVMNDPVLDGWGGFGLAVQAYHKAAPAVIDHIIALAKKRGVRVQMRLVKGAYWDTEIKLAQEEGLEAFPVYTRKDHTDAAYLACALKMLEAQDEIYPMFGTHNAYTVAAIRAMGQGKIYEFQRLFGMGEGLFDLIMGGDDVSASIYAPVGPHEDLLPYLVRRLLENGANSSFVNRVMDPDASVEDLVRDPVDKLKTQKQFKHPKIALPKALFDDEVAVGRLNSAGMDLNAPDVIARLEGNFSVYDGRYMALPLIGGEICKEGVADEVKNPADTGDIVGRVYQANSKIVERAFEVGARGYTVWAGSDAAVRAQALRAAADLLEERCEEMMVLLCREAGKTFADALAEVREAVDFLRYYAGQGEGLFASEGHVLPGPTGEDNRYFMNGRGVFVCISPWNFPLAIFTGQVAAALMAGNAVLAKPAEQTPLIAMEMVKMLHEAGVHPDALALITGDGRVGAALVAHHDVGGVAFTGSTAVAREINRTLAQKSGPIVPLIAETGGQNTMIVDSTALPEQVADDVILSAFGSAGQRCSALRILCLQEDNADKIIHMLQGAMKELSVGDPSKFLTDIGPVIDTEALSLLVHHREALHGFSTLLYEVPLEMGLQTQGSYFGPLLVELEDLKGLSGEVFGPILHVVRYKAEALDDLLDEIARTGYGLTLGIHSRMQSFHERVAARVSAGNVYVNRSMTGAIVGSQPFGGQGLSGTGPKAGGPQYLPRFAHERVISVDTTAAGGNASLVTIGE